MLWGKHAKTWRLKWRKPTVIITLQEHYGWNVIAELSENLLNTYWMLEQHCRQWFTFVHPASGPFSNHVVYSPCCVFWYPCNAQLLFSRLMDCADGKPDMTDVASIQRVGKSSVTLTLNNPRHLNSLCIFSCFPHHQKKPNPPKAGSHFNSPTYKGWTWAGFRVDPFALDKRFRTDDTVSV